MGPGVQRPHPRDAFGDFGRFVEHFELVIFGGQEIEPRVIARVGGDLFFQDLDVPVVLAPPRLPGPTRNCDRCAAVSYAAARLRPESRRRWSRERGRGTGSPAGWERADHVIRGGTLWNPTSDCAAPGNSPRFRPERPAFRSMGARGRVERLIRVQHQDPAAGRVRDGAIAGGREIDGREIERNHLAPRSRPRSRGVPSVDPVSTTIDSPARSPTASRHRARSRSSFFTIMQRLSASGVPGIAVPMINV